MSTSLVNKVHKLFLEDTLGHTDMDSEVGFVDKLCNRDISGDAGQLVGLVRGEAFDGNQEVDHFLNGGFGGNPEIGIGVAVTGALAVVAIWLASRTFARANA